MARPSKFGFDPYVEDDSRRQGRRKVQRNFLIVCEGLETEPRYFDAIRKRMKSGAGSKITIVGAGTHTQELVRRADLEIEQRRKDGLPGYYYVWIVFDKDSFSDADFDQAIAMIASKDALAKPNVRPFWRSAWSNEAFELWYLLHFQEVSVPMPRERIFDLLTGHLGCKYQKNEDGMFERLAPMLSQAERRASQLSRRMEGLSPHQCNPCTRVGELVSELISYT